MSYTPLPIGIDDFKKMRINGYYYTDKTWLIKELLDKKGEVNLFTRPRRFGKTLNLSMLKYYFEKPVDGSSNKALFEGLKIMSVGERYTREQEQYPVIMLTLKSAKQRTFELAYAKLKETIAGEFYRHQDILLRIENEERRAKFIALRDEKAEYSDYLTALAFLSNCLYEAYGTKTIILIDEYDVPLENAYYAGFYEEMITFIRSLFESALKTNPYLEFSVITGCLRISKESIFTGLNNLKMISIVSEEYSEHFGFVEEEVRQMLSFYGRDQAMDTMREWYDGYRFGETEVYNPWSVINYVERLYTNENAFPLAAWSNTSSNSIIKDLIYRADEEVRDEIESLVNGQTIEKKIHEDITYDDIYQSEDNLWNFLYFTGYLKAVNIRQVEEDVYASFKIPNREVRSIYKNTITNWFRDEVEKLDLSQMYEAMLKGNAETLQEYLEEQLQNTISYMDNKEAFYHGFLLDLMAQLKGYLVKSNREAGMGRYDTCIYSHNVRKPVILMEFKLADTYQALEKSSQEAMNQIHERKYYLEFEKEGHTHFYLYGIGFYKKQLRVLVEER